MRILLIGPTPPPHGGISVHVSGLRRKLLAEGVECEVLDTSEIPSRFRFVRELAGYSSKGWTLHLHTNGHNRNSWLLALLCGIAGKAGGACVLTLHSGMMPGYLRTAPAWRRSMTGLVCHLYSRIICVGPELRDAAIAAGAPMERTEIAFASVALAHSDVAIDPQLLAWIERHSPVLSTTLFFRPEYGFELLLDGLAQLRRTYPAFGCLVMGSGEQSAQAAQQVREADLENNVLLLGDVDHDSCRALMSRSTVFLRATLEDGDSISVREALAMGVPVVASRVGSRPDGAMLFHPGDVQDMVSTIETAIVKASKEAYVST
jgi:glycogen(starch) synthase